MKPTYSDVILLGLVLGATGCAGFLLGGWAVIRSRKRFILLMGNLKDFLWVLAFAPYILFILKLSEHWANDPAMHRPWFCRSWDSYAIPVVCWFAGMFVLSCLAFWLGHPEKVKPWPLHLYGKAILVFAPLSLASHYIDMKTNKDFAGIICILIFGFWLGANKPGQDEEAQESQPGASDSAKEPNPVVTLLALLFFGVLLLAVLTKNADPRDGRKLLFRQAAGLTEVAHLSEELIAPPGHPLYWRMAGEGKSQNGDRQRWIVEIEPSTGRVLSRRQDDP